MNICNFSILLVFAGLLGNAEKFIWYLNSDLSFFSNFSFCKLFIFNFYFQFSLSTNLNHYLSNSAQFSLYLSHRIANYKHSLISTTLNQHYHQPYIKRKILVLFPKPKEASFLSSRALIGRHRKYTGARLRPLQIRTLFACKAPESPE